MLTRAGNRCRDEGSLKALFEQIATAATLKDVGYRNELIGELARHLDAMSVERACFGAICSQALRCGGGGSVPRVKGW